MKRFFVSLLGCALFAAVCAAQAPTLTVHSTPEGAELALNREPVGVTPFSTTNVTSEALIAVSKPGFKTAWQTVRLAPGESKAVSVELEPVKGLLLFRTSPVSAEVSVNKIAYGSTPLILNSLPVGSHVVRLSAQGYMPRDIKVDIADSNPMVFDETLISGSGLIQVTSEPSGAEVRVNGFPRGLTPCSVDRVDRGKARIEITLAGHHPFTQELGVNAGETHRLNAVLKPLEGSLQIVTIPLKARVYVNDTYKGESDIDLGRLESGSYRVRVELKNHRTQARTVVVPPGENIIEEFRLASNVGRIAIVTQPPRAAVFLDGRRVGTTKATPQGTLSQQLLLTDIPEGPHELQVTARGYKDLQQTVTVPQGELITLNLALVKMFIPDYWVETLAGRVQGVLIQQNEFGIELETRPGLKQTVPTRDIRGHGYILEAITGNPKDNDD